MKGVKITIQKNERPPPSIGIDGYIFIFLSLNRRRTIHSVRFLNYIFALAFLLANYRNLLLKREEVPQRRVTRFDPYKQTDISSKTTINEPSGTKLSL